MQKVSGGKHSRFHQTKDQYAAETNVLRDFDAMLSRALTNYHRIMTSQQE